MGVLDKVIAAVAPEPSEEDRLQARAEAKALGKGGWLAMVVAQHEAVEAAFEAVKNAKSAASRRAHQKRLATLLTGHSIAEEVVLYPAMASHDQKGHSGEAFTEQSAAKVQTAALEELDPMSADYLDKLEHLRAAVSHHVYEEESQWLPELRRIAEPQLQTRLTRRYQEEYARYTGER